MTQYIDKAALVAKIESIENETNYEPFTDEVLGKREVCKDIRDFLNTLEPIPVYEESVNENLEEAFKKIVDFNKYNFLEIFKAGAKWKEQQMMNKAVSAHINYPLNLRINSGCGVDLTKSGGQLGDKCKIIIIKQENDYLSDGNEYLEVYDRL